jgi:HK97 family phage major capsid protein
MPNLFIGNIVPPDMVAKLPPAARAAYEKANKRRVSEMQQLRSQLPAGTKVTSRPGGFVAVGKSQSPAGLTVTAKSSKGSEPAMPAAVAQSPAKATPSNPPSPRQRTRSATITPRQAAAAKSCRSEEDRRRLYDIGMELRARLGVFLDNRDLVAERYCLNELDLDIRATATEGNPPGGGYLVNSPLSNSVIALRARTALSRRVSNVVPMTSNTLSIPEVTGELTVYYPTETAAITPSDLTLGSLFLEVKRRAVLSYNSRELYDDSLISTADLFLRSAAYVLAAKEDRELILGDGTSAFNGEVGLIAAIGAGGIVSAAAGHDTLAELTIDDWTAVMARLPERHVDARLSWIMSAAVYFGSALRACGGNSQGFDELGRPMLLGFPVHFSVDMPTSSAASTVVALFGNFEQAVILGDRLPFSMTMSEHAAFENDVIAFRGLSRYDILVHGGGDATNAGAYVGLATAS